VGVPVTIQRRSTLSLSAKVVRLVIFLPETCPSSITRRFQRTWSRGEMSGVRCGTHLQSGTRVRASFRGGHVHSRRAWSEDSDLLLRLSPSAEKPESEMS
jgi:hypothetical protein